MTQTGKNKSQNARIKMRDFLSGDSNACKTKCNHHSTS